jgi:hypothetical protein
MTILFRPQGAFGWLSYTTSRDTIKPLTVFVRPSLNQIFDLIGGQFAHFFGSSRIPGK